MSSFWNFYIFALTGITFLGLGALIYFTRKMPSSSDPEETTGHSFDGIEEYNKPMPKWWLNLFYITIVFAIGYLIYFPLGNWTGIGNWTSSKQLAEETARHQERFGDIYTQLASMPIEELKDNTQAQSIGQQLFLTNCSICHGQNGQGYYGFPNLADNDWLWGGTGDAIKTTLVQGRRAQMPAWRDTLGEQGIAAATEYVLKLSGNDHNTILARNGEVIYQQMCAACHAADGTGNYSLGAPNLTNNIWLYDLPGQDLRRDIIVTLNEGRAGYMPGWIDILGEERVHILSGYVYGLSN